MSWNVAQQHEKDYSKNVEETIWKIPYSLEYWQKFLNFNSSKKGIEIGCGNHGAYNFTQNIIGIDTINFHKPNFVQASAESLPFKKIDFAILCNSLDHCQKPEEVLCELSFITNQIILWTYIYPKFVSYFLSKFDKMHPHHFTKKELLNLIDYWERDSYSVISPLFFSKYTKNKKMKIKLLIMKLLNIQGICLHLRRYS